MSLDDTRSTETWWRSVPAESTAAFTRELLDQYARTMQQYMQNVQYTTPLHCFDWNGEKLGVQVEEPIDPRMIMPDGI